MKLTKFITADYPETREWIREELADAVLAIASPQYRLEVRSLSPCHH
ncbi:MAG: hypothetical protein ICV63_06185 [Coleofasciculus sp. Co-bin14]|nr:hypothetical protein [Coleofasciculus sp. Co-bin14]